MRNFHRHSIAWLLALTGVAAGDDADGDGLPDGDDSCPGVVYEPGFDTATCGPIDLDPSNDCNPECRTRDRIARYMLDDGRFITRISFAVVKDREVYVADAFTYVGQGVVEHDPAGIHRLYRIGSTSKPVMSVTAKIMEERGELAFGDWVNDEDATQILDDGEVSLFDLLGHRDAFSLDIGAIHLYCYPDDIGAFWREEDDAVSPRYDSSTYGNLNGGYEYSAFNYSLAGAYMAGRAGESLAATVQERLFDAAGMCTATFDGERAFGTEIGDGPGVAQGSSMHVGPYINLVSPGDPLCEDNFYNSDDLYGDPYSWQYYFLNEADAEARDPAGGVIASAIDLGYFASALLQSYAAPGGIVSQQGIRQLWEARTSLCGSGCPYQPYYATGFFTDSLADDPVREVEHGGSRPGFASAFVMRPEAGLGIAILANGDASTVGLANLAKIILDDFEGFTPGGDVDGDGDVDSDDFFAFLDAFADGDASVCDIDGDGDCDAEDFFAYLDLIVSGC